ncbi:MAG: hypothetical protein ACLRQF_17495 [Thomasclavelia ramosa]
MDAWHKDLPEFLQIRTNNGDASNESIFFLRFVIQIILKLAKNDLEASWCMMCPHEIHEVKGYYLEDCYGEEWERKYYECVEDDQIPKRVMTARNCSFNY